jgi:hypothetical protein
MWIDKDTKPVPSCPMCRAIIMPSDISKLFKGMSKPPKPVPDVPYVVPHALAAAWLASEALWLAMDDENF